jgi:preprotein translocase subunit YajC|tara:strand:+ start:147 stop:509 length:363 start_codon:yes stop_codon:yes gene_type:complete
MGVMFSIIFYTVLAVVAFYFILLQPVLKQQRNRKRAMQAMQIGDEIVTTGGIIGEVKDILTPLEGNTEILLEIAPNVQIRATTDSIERRLTTLEPVSKKSKSQKASLDAIEKTSKQQGVH